MKVKNKLTEKEIELLKKIDIEITEKEYSTDDIIEMTDNTILLGEISNLKGEDYKTTDIANEYANLVDKLVELSNIEYENEKK